MRFLIFCVLFCSAAMGFADQQKDSFSWPCGVVSFEQCFKESKYGRQETENMQETGKKMQTLLEEKVTAIKETEKKLNDSDFRDSLSPAADKELQEKYTTLRQEFDAYQEQLRNMEQQLSFQSYQTLFTHIQKAARSVEKEKQIPFLLRKEACITFPSSADVTYLIIQEMDEAFDKENALNENTAAK